MGLDMFLKARMGLYGRKDARSQKIQELFADTGLEVDGVDLEAGYWRKANAIHKWFVENVQKGIDDCGDYMVSREQLTELLDLCRRVRDFKHLAEDQLPTTGGFFFGDTGYGDGYYEDVDLTIRILERALELPPEFYFVYHSSW